MTTIPIVYQKVSYEISVEPEGYHFVWWFASRPNAGGREATVEACLKQAKKSLAQSLVEEIACQPATPKILLPTPANLAAVKKDEEAQAADLGEYENMTIKELKRLLTKSGHKVPSKASKAELVNLAVQFEV
ncbi:MAG: hypothetical protein ACRDEA_05120 [Microcystaceae cyanobacterium]